MTDFIRPEVIAALTRWRGVLGALATGVFGFWLGVRSYGTLSIIGWAILVLSPVLLLMAVQRRRFADAGGEGPGVVEVVEGRIGYLSPGGGGFVALDEVDEIFITMQSGASVWLLRRWGQPDLVIPLGAEGAEELFDALVALPGMTAAVLVAAAASGEAHQADGSPVRIWRRSSGRIPYNSGE